MNVFGRAAVAVVGGLVSAPALAADIYCVSCSGPQASYVCEVTLPEGVVPSQSPQLYCAYRLAAEGSHASCASRRSGDAPCPGDYRQLAYQGPSLVAPAPGMAPAEVEVESSGAAVEPSADDPLDSTPETTDGEPKTVVELTEQVAETVGDGVATVSKEAKDMTRFGEDAAEATGEPEQPSASSKLSKAAKSALNCLASLFEECD
ncbi:MAG: hypothetical protein R3D57_11025 [Hyphomicrobiaceae bacterium]